ncbi:glycosyltransferase family 2 protein [Acetobacter fallax]|uniref:Glycosyltransferase n=1 Tax=Acetobacter fallax TaxID=1737473 RepID=A0ABX0K890_9PROT|nr:glycosyltransferase family 2 protein [Acetobacter fallax]NHO31226.1 glycosyltransferase [Acetobacter fallax]NHO34783.1 glycosyltransferase [Acetobacter fallax]
MTTHPSFSLITSTLGRQDILGRLLASLEKQSFRDFEIIVVDQNPEGYLDDVIARYTGSLRLTHLRSPKGLSVGRNAGLKVATGDIIAFPDDDCWYGPETLAEVTELFRNYSGYDMLVGRTTDAEGRNSIVPSLPRDCDIDRINVIDAANSNTIFMRRVAEAGTGLFDERLGTGGTSIFQSAEDRDYIARALEGGFRVRFVRDLVIFHEQIVTDDARHLARVRKYSLGDGAYYRKHGYGIGRIFLMIAKALGGIPFRLLRRQSPELKAKFTYSIFLLSGYLRWNDRNLKV